ncbi:hypothetical protein B0H13DRAFT_2318186 [Mycena leptocephala]|nr:hypothetical protein B0H13DRAFT_2318186 [Mycena leptocephala]
MYYKIVGGRWSGVEANDRGKNPDWTWAGDQCKCDACQCFDSGDAAPRPDDATSRRDGPGPAHGWKTWTGAWHNFQVPLPAPPAPKRDDADVYAGPEMRVVRSATPHPVFTVITSLIPIPLSLSRFPPRRRSLTLTIPQSTPSPALRHRQRPHLGQGGVVIVPRFSVQVGTGAKAPPDPPFVQIPVAFLVELVLLEDETPSFLFLRLPVVLRTETQSVYVAAHLHRAGAALRWRNRDASEVPMLVLPAEEAHVRTCSFKGA